MAAMSTPVGPATVTRDDFPGNSDAYALANQATHPLWQDRFAELAEREAALELLERYHRVLERGNDEVRRKWLARRIRDTLYGCMTRLNDASTRLTEEVP